MNGQGSKQNIDDLVKEGSYQWILDEFPFGVSVQTIDREILYENEAVKDLVGSYITRHCFNRWHYLPGKGDEPCNDCPATIGFKDGKSHKVFRKTLGPNGEDIFIEIQFLPVKNENQEIDKFIEIITNVSLLDKAKVLSSTPIEEISQSLQVSFVKFGETGGEVISTDNLDFAKSENLEEIVVQLTVYIFSGVMQGFEDQEGLFGPFPVLDKTEYLMETYLFRIKDDEAKDPRLKGMQPSMILFFFPREYYFLFEKRNDIEEFISQKITEWGKLQNITQESHKTFAEDIRNFLEKLI
ncbi:MAG: hypothetical protein GOP50_04785 [Candidatus Heimdallarchaeota archaeon]|nr:hypothetical protein [Candidatus Heimdallarchaeota archaeon]